VATPLVRAALRNERRSPADAKDESVLDMFLSVLERDEHTKAGSEKMRGEALLTRKLAAPGASCGQIAR
jgi:hypothetical protein